MPNRTEDQNKSRNLLRSGYQAVSHAVERRRHPDRFIKTDQTPWDEIYRNGIMAVRHYSLPPCDQVDAETETVRVRKRKHAIPLILVPALGIHVWTFDIKPARSMVKYMMARGFDVYAIDWGAPSQSDHALSLNTYVNEWFPAAINAVLEHSGKDEVNVVGYCMGGLLSMLYMGGHPDHKVRNLATIASPVNFHRNGPSGRLLGLLSVPAMKLHDWFKIRLDPLDEELFHVPGKLLTFGFKMTNPPAIVTSYMDLVRNITDREYVTDYMTMGQWFNDMVDYPGATVRELIEKIIIANGLAGGKITIGDRLIDFGTIKSDLMALAGTTDKIVSIRAAQDILKVVGSRNKEFNIAPGGHAGVFAGSKAPGSTWKIIADWLDTRSAKQVRQS